MKATAVTWDFVRHRLTDPVGGVDNWQAEAFGLLVAERLYPNLLLWSQKRGRGEHGLFRRYLNLVWSVLKDPARREPGLITARDLERISHAIPDHRRLGATEDDAVAAGTVCMHLVRFLQSSDRDDIARLATAACAHVYVDQHQTSDKAQVSWASSIPFDEISAYDAAIRNAPEIQSELERQSTDLTFVESLNGPLERRFDAVLHRAFGYQMMTRS